MQPAIPSLSNLLMSSLLEGNTALTALSLYWQRQTIAIKLNLQLEGEASLNICRRLSQVYGDDAGDCSNESLKGRHFPNDVEVKVLSETG